MTSSLIEAIDVFISGDWGEGACSPEFSNEVACIRGADIENVQGGNYYSIPHRYLSVTLLKSRKLQVGDVIVEKSGGSPTQSTGRTCYISEDLIKEKQDVVCSNFCTAFRLKEDWDYKYIYYYIQNIYNQGIFFNFEGKTSGIRNLLIDIAFKSIHLPVIDKSIQVKISNILDCIDRKIALNTQINVKLEEMAKQLYDYWFVQFDFPDKNGKPYKSSGGKMVWNEKLQREIPEGWDKILISDLIKEKKAGDWGQNEKTDSYALKVNCIRGADFNNPTNAPVRFINTKNSNRLLEEDDIVVEISGGSPVQATGRSLYVTKELLDNYDDDLTCSNFCQALTFYDKTIAPYFFYMWNMFYDNSIMFNYEGKTSGIKNLLIDIFLNNHWYLPPTQLLLDFATTTKSIMSLKDSNIKETNHLTHLRDSLLPMLMNGQISIE